MIGFLLLLVGFAAGFGHMVAEDLKYFETLEPPKEKDPREGLEKWQTKKELWQK